MWLAVDTSMLDLNIFLIYRLIHFYSINRRIIVLCQGLKVVLNRKESKMKIWKVFYMYHWSSNGMCPTWISRSVDRDYEHPAHNFPAQDEPTKDETVKTTWNYLNTKIPKFNWGVFFEYSLLKVYLMISQRTKQV